VSIHSSDYPALFLDRDGVINREAGYITNTDGIEFTEHIFEICRFFKNKFYKIVVTTNQSGIGRGIISQAQYNQINSFIIDKFNSENCSIDLILTATIDPTNNANNHEEAYMRKPNPGMILKAKLELNLDLNRSVLIGDNLSDMHAGKNASISRLYLIKNPPVRSEFFESFADLKSFLVRLKSDFSS
jgi:D-glycero-D-manno-heptose 1,7-bisphosphate phosphatase